MFNMKTKHILIALAMLAALTMVACKNNNKKTQAQEPTQEEVQEMKQALADSVLAKIDAIVNQFYDANSKKFTFRSMELTDKEKAVKPDYLLDPSEVNNLVSKSQKINALGFLMVDLGVRYLYDMPVDEAREAIAKLALEVNLTDDYLSATENQKDFSILAKKMYNSCLANNELPAFWQYNFAGSVEFCYIFAQNPKLYFSKITEKEWQSFFTQVLLTIDALKELAPYDPEIAQVLELRNKNRAFESDQARDQVLSTLQSTQDFFIDNKDKYIARRNALLQ